MRGTDAPRARRSHGRPWAQDGEHARPGARVREAAAHLYPRWIACRSRCPRRRAGPARQAPRSPQDSLLSPADWRPSITVLGRCGLRDDAIELSITLDSSGGDFISSELTEKRRRLIEFDDRATRLGLEDEHSQRSIKCRTDVMASYLDRHEWIADQVLLGLPELADHQQVRTMVEDIDDHEPLLALHRLQRLHGTLGRQAFQL